MTDNKIPFYDLYGEPFISTELAVVHVENIAHRSLGLGWEIQPHRHNRLSQIVAVFDNNWTVELDERKLELNGNWLVIIPTGVVHSFHFASDTKGFVLSINNDFLTANGSNSTLGSLTGLEKLIWQTEAVEFKDGQQIAQFCGYLNMLNNELNNEQFGRKMAVNQLLKLILLSVARQQGHQAMTVGSTSRESDIIFKFRGLIEKHYTEQLTVKEYSEHLNISVSKLNRLCQDLLKDSPKAVIHKRIIIEAKRHLIYTQQSVEVISFLLGFSDPAYFSRFFKQMVGVTAGKFRQQFNT